MQGGVAATGVGRYRRATFISGSIAAVVSAFGDLLLDELSKRCQPRVKAS